MKRHLIFAALTVAGASTASAHTLRFVNLPFSEGTLFIQVQQGNKNISMQAIEVTADTADVQVELDRQIERKVSVNAFQDLDGNRALDFDSYGRPAEPCLRTDLSVSDSTSVIHLELKRY